MSIPTPRRRSFLLRLWQNSHRTALKASLIDVHDPSCKLHFASLEDLYLYLKEAVAMVDSVQTGGEGEVDQ